MISYDLAHGSRVSLKVYDVRGRLVRTLESRDRSPGSYRVTWLGNDDGGASVASGVYFIRFEADGIDTTERVTLVR